MQSTYAYNSSAPFSLADVDFRITRIHRFGVLIEGPYDPDLPPNEIGLRHNDYLHQYLLTPNNRENFYDLVCREGLVICRNLRMQHTSYRKVRGKSSHQRLSPAEYFHHDGSPGSQKPRLVEIRCPFQTHGRNVDTAIAPFPDVIRAMWQALPDSLRYDQELKELVDRMEGSLFWNFDRVKYGGTILDFRSDESIRSSPVFETPGSIVDGDHCADTGVKDWEKMQGRMTRLVRKEYDAESCRAYFREVDRLAGAFQLPWQMGESRLILNNHPDLAFTMQHRRSLPIDWHTQQQNGSLLKRWPVEELPD